jgi:ATP-dependent Clp protease ATP-binding subunit ClpA
MFERFTDSARACVARAQDEAGSLGHEYIGTEHILAALATDERGVGGQVLRDLGLTPDTIRADIRNIVGGSTTLDHDALASIGIDLDEVRKRVDETFGPGALDRASGRHEPRRVPFTPRSKKSLELALKEAVGRGDDFIGSEHLLLGVSRVAGGVACRILSEHGCTREGLARAVDDARRAA